MISLYSKNLLVIEDGHCQTLCLDEMRRDLRACCLATGIHEEWLAEHLTLALEDYLYNHESDSRPTRADVDRVLLRLLMDAGYGDVAGEYCRRRQLHPTAMAMADAPQLQAWSKTGVLALLAARVPLNAELQQDLAARVCEKLASLGFAAVTDALITEIATHILPELAATPRPTPPPPGSPAAAQWFLTGPECSSLLQQLEADSRWHSLFHIRPVSSLLPAVWLTVEINRLAEFMEPKAVTELALWPELQHLIRLTGELLLRLHQAVHDKSGAAANPPPVHLTISGLNHLANRLSGPLSKAKARHLSRSIADAISHDVPLALAIPVIVQLKP